ncbi:LysM peptidoglycan-binding and 3D domain-containing protein [Metabacillus sediminilitoris]|uniref:LysM peptidoglycan-binding domain-containing protein n=1 Tax=Metabacillus sediminilitoris TaxID=2567941 RepID=A0A4S4BPY6_9BACI|nr:3D domain-containing protein [Metabacillus sediminilitoris]QGQ47713.1 LysM peptidoglycan-binding domain-containing protein [Metabacillus sediminilitoris]THF76818.1 LysM peptidoglycan-binding domain-containing protein [Metabacillus sediminilitoris]
MKKSILSFITVVALTVGITGNASAEEVNVQEGDTLWDIAEQKDVSVEELKDWNELTGDIIQPEDKLFIQEYYEIIKGDSLWNIAVENNVSVDDLKEWNGIVSHIIHPGNKIIIEHKDNKQETTTTATNNQVKSVTVENDSTKPVEKSEVAVPVEKTEEKSDEEASVEKSAEKEITVEATAYTANCEGCSGTTKTGIDLKANPNQKVIAVDPDVIPLGTKVHVEGYGEAIAGDTGGAIDGKKIDVFIPSESEAKQWGRKDVQVKILD